jgi:5-methylcytosine-specific restriction endonuclease McrA
MTRSPFISVNPTVEDCWRGIILYGQNSASYKFALAESLLQLNPQAGQLLKLEDLAPVFGKAIAGHISHSPKQGTRPGKFLNSVQRFNTDGNLEELIKATVAGGFQDVLDAFHNIGTSSVLHKFFIDERRANKGIRITDEFSKLAEGYQIKNIIQEVDSRWRLVETAWNLGIAANHLVVQHDHDLGQIFTFDRASKRTAVTSSRGALNGYQKGSCFYCGADLRLLGEDFNTDVDHFFPHKLKRSNLDLNLDGVWNLVLSCQSCNRGPGGKFDRIPSLKLLEKLHIRNEFLIGSHHPLRETLMNQTGTTTHKRIDFLNRIYKRVQLNPLDAWEPTDVYSPGPFDSE